MLLKSVDGNPCRRPIAVRLLGGSYNVRVTISTRKHSMTSPTRMSS